MLSIKEGVSLLGLDSKLILAAIVADQVYSTHSIENCVITSATDSKHGEHSHHYKGLAIDLRTRDMDGNQKQIITSDIQKQLGTEFQVIFEVDHIHIEYDPL
jgi:hypothetical protein